MSILYIVATPIGNLQDITLRAIEVLRAVDAVLAEDTRVTKKLLSHLGIHKPVFRYIYGKDYSRFEKIALTTDAGTPGVSDPGQALVKNLLSAGFEIVPIPGPSALSAIVSASDIDLKEFLFLGFPPHKKGRQAFFKKVSESGAPVIIFESPHRIQRTLKDIRETSGNRYVNIGRELTKIYEEIFRGNLEDAAAHFTGEKSRGEFVIIMGKHA